MKLNIDTKSILEYMWRVRKKIFWVVFIISGLFILGIVTDVTPYIRGPVDPITPSRWPYYFVNTFNKVWAPIAVIVIYLLLYSIVESKRKWNKWQEAGFLTLIIFVIFLFQISLVYFSRFGVTILFRRMVDPGMNSYFIAATKVNDINKFLLDFPAKVKDLPMHAGSHPPGSVLFFQGIISLFENFPQITNFFGSFIRPPRAEVKIYWLALSTAQRVAAGFSAFLMHFLAALAVLPLYYLVKNLFDRQIAWRTVFIYGIIPSVSFFAVIMDPFYALFPLVSLTVLITGIKRSNKLLIFISGFILAVGLFFSLSILPILAMMGVYVILTIYKNKNYEKILGKMFYFLTGLLSFFILLTWYGFNIIASFLAVITHLTPRSYIPWLLFNPYDFLVYLGIHLAIFFILASYYFFKKGSLTKDLLMKTILSFWSVFMIITILGVNKGEVGRTWVTFMFIPTILATIYMTKILKFSKMTFMWIMFLMFLQVVVMEEFWVPVW